MQNNISFKGCIPVEFYAKNPKTNKYIPIVKDENIKKCQRFVVRNLNKTLKKPNDIINISKTFKKRNFFIFFTSFIHRTTLKLKF